MPFILVCSLNSLQADQLIGVMVSTNPKKSSFKLTATAISLVVLLHVLTAMALTTIKTPVNRTVKIAAPIEIQLLAPAIEIEAPKIQIATESQSKKQTEIQYKLKPIAAPKSQVTKSLKPVDKPKSATKELLIKQQTTKVNSTQSIIKGTVNNNLKSTPVQTQPPSTAATLPTSTKIVTQPREISAMQAEEGTDINNKDEALKAQALIEAEAARVAQNQADIQAQAAKKAALVSNEPVRFLATSANWASAPLFSFPNRASRGTRSGDVFRVVLMLRVNKQGGIDSVRIAQSSSNSIIDREAQRQVRSGKFKPFTKDNVPVVGDVTLPIAYKVP